MAKHYWNVCSQQQLLCYTYSECNTQKTYRDIWYNWQEWCNDLKTLIIYPYWCVCASFGETVRSCLVTHRWMKRRAMSQQKKIKHIHYSGVIMIAMASLITGISIVYSTVCSSADPRKHRGSPSYVGGIQRQVNSWHKGSVTRKMLLLDDVIMRACMCTRIFVGALHHTMHSVSVVRRNFSS